MQTPVILQHLLKEEGAFFHPAIQVFPILSMGGGHGVVTTESLPPGTLLAKIPRRCMITAGRARRYLASREYQYRQFELGDTQKGGTNKISTTILAKLEQELERNLSPTNAIICFLLLAAAEQNRFAGSSFQGTNDTVSIMNKDENTHSLCSHKWMKTWLLSLPSKYDNLLELFPDVNEAKCSEAGIIVKPGESVATDSYLRPFLLFEQLRKKVILEQERVKSEFQICQSVISVLNALSFKADNGSILRIPAKLEEFLWAYNTLMSRGFAYDPEVWALMPWVDYFNYALTSNATMKFSEKQQAYVFETLLPITSGEQIFLHYGSYTDMELLLWYGFTLTPSLLPEFSRSNAQDERSQILRMILFADENILNVTNNASRMQRDDIWLKAVHTALGYCFSPWAEADGSYPRSKPHESWFELLLASYLSKKKNSKIGEENYYYHFSAGSSVVLEKLVNMLIEIFLISRTQQISPQMAAQRCCLGARGPSSSMMCFLKYVSSLCSGQDIYTSLSPSGILRAICFAELFCNEIDVNTEVTVPLSKSTADISSLASVKVMARESSIDAASLLHFLAFNASEEELDFYLSMESE
ncbi:SET domain [Trypanosoma melophagium]|uniref:SET domain n=1 Tax=Trypanosoma melophagium TaxID=715481 RepID=UPI00351A220F|nr:SET domain [Trypanosoma melophagium]